ncbi:MAG: hypothetical protein AB1633_00185 [Elusimicrobiota bacterium]
MGTNVSGEKVGEIFAEIGVKFDKLEADFKKVESLGKKTAEKLEYDFKQLRIDIDSRLATMKIGEVKKYYQALKIQMDQKLKFNADEDSIEKTAVAMDAARARMKEFGNEGEKVAAKIEAAENKIGLSIKKILGVFGIAYGLNELFAFSKQAIKASAELEALTSHFKGTERDLELFRVATARTVTDANLIKLSNQATDLGLTLQEQAIYFSIAETASDKYGIGIEEAMSQVIMATEGNERGLRRVGVQKEIFQEQVKNLTKEFAAQGIEIDAEAAKQIRIQALIRATGITIEDVTNTVQDSKDKIESWGTAWDKIQRTVGGVVLPVFSDFVRLLENAYGWASKLVTTLGNIPKNVLSQFGIDISDEALGVTKRSQKKAETGLAPEGSLERLAQDIRAENAKKIKVEWTAVGKTAEEIGKHIESLATVQKTLIPGSVEWLNNWKEIEKLSKLITNPFKDRNNKAEEEAAKFAQEELKRDRELQKLKEDNIAKYYEEVKFADDDYFEWKADLIMREISNEEIKNEKLKQLVDDRYEYERDKLTSPSLRGKTAEDVFNEYQNYKPIVRNPREQTEAALDASKKLRDSMLNTVSEFSGNLSSAMDNAGQRFEIHMNNALHAAVKIADVLSKITSGEQSIVSGGFSILSSIISVFSAHGGGEFVGTSRGVMRMAGGGSFIVPTGYDNDSFPLMVETGEKVTVTPASQVYNNDNSGVIAALARMETKLGMLNRTIIDKDFNTYINADLPTLQFVKEVVNPDQNKLARIGITKQ